MFGAKVALGHLSPRWGCDTHLARGTRAAQSLAQPRCAPLNRAITQPIRVMHQIRFHGTYLSSDLMKTHRCYIYSSRNHRLKFYMPWRELICSPGSRDNNHMEVFPSPPAGLALLLVFFPSALGCWCSAAMGGSSWGEFEAGHVPEGLSENPPSHHCLKKIAIPLQIHPERETPPNHWIIKDGKDLQGQRIVGSWNGLGP